MKIGYLIADFPKLSETFVAGEVYRLSALGARIQPYSFSAPPAADVSKLPRAAASVYRTVRYLKNASAAAAALARPADVLKLHSANNLMHGHSSAKPNSPMRLARAIALGRQLARDGIDHLHAHWPYATEVAWLINRLTGVPYSVSIHAHEVAHESGHFPRVFETLSFAAFCNRTAMEYLLDRLPSGARGRCHLVHHGVDLRGFAPLPPPPRASVFHVLSAGRLTPTKGFHRLIRACALARIRGIDARLTILGRGAAEAQLRSTARSLGFLPFLELPGWVPQDRLTPYLARSNVFALLADTTFHDGLPNVVLEAMASARPVILSPLPAAPEAVSNGTEGFVLADADDAEGFVAAAQTLRARPDLIASMGEAARRRVVAEHDADVQAAKLLHLFEQSWRDRLRPVANQ